MSIAEVVLFISSSSKHCAKPFQYVQQTQLPIIPVRLDTPEIRQKVMNSRNLPIRNVPTLLIRYSDGSVQQFVGEDKTMMKLNELYHQRSEADTYQNDSKKSKVSKLQVKPKKNQKKPKVKKNEVIEDIEETEEPEEPEEPEETEDIKESEILSTEEENEDDEDEDIPQMGPFNKQKRKGPSPKTDGLRVGSDKAPRPSIQELQKRAREMEKQYENFYNYDK